MGIFHRKRVGPEYYFERGEDCIKKGNLPWALESFSKAIEFKPDYELAYLKRAEVHKRLGKTREAVWDYIKFLQVDRRTGGTAGDLKEVLKEAITIARINLQRDEAKKEMISFGIPTLLEELLDGYDLEGEYSDTRFYDVALSWLEGNPPRNRFYIGFIKLIKKEFDGALKEFDEAIGENPEKGEAYYFRGVALLKKAKMSESRLSGREDKVRELSEMASSNFEQALRMGFGWRICPACGYRASTAVNFCMRCGKRLLVG